MGEKRAYQRELDSLIASLQAEDIRPGLLLHSCCAPCSSYVIEYLSHYFDITVFYYNPNIDSSLEYKRRVEEQKRFIRDFPASGPVSFLEGPFERDRYYEAVKGLEGEPEGGKRCRVCFALRLEETARAAADGHFDYFTTTLSISPMKDPVLLNTLGEELGHKYGVPYLVSEFRKRNGFLRSTELSKEYGLYRQDYCGCVFSKREREIQKEERSAQERQQDVSVCR